MKTMKKLNMALLSIALLVITGLTSCTAQNKKTETFGVRGNCGMCKSTIEKAAKKVKGVSKIEWDKARKQVEVTFDSSKTNLDKIHQAIASSGYDTDKVSGDKKAYSNLPGCCKYDHNMKMSLKGDVKDTSTH